jgi:hypothetical protein
MHTYIHIQSYEKPLYRNRVWLKACRSVKILTTNVSTILYVLYILHSTHTVHLYVSYDSHNKRGSFPKQRQSQSRSVGKSVLVSSPILGPRPHFCYCQTVAGLLMWGALSHERRGLSFKTAAGPGLRSHCRVRVSLDSWPHFTVSDSRLPKPGRPGPRIYIPQEQSGPVIPPGTGFLLHRFLRLAGLRWRYSNPPPHGGSINNTMYYLVGLFQVT